MSKNKKKAILKICGLTLLSFIILASLFIIWQIVKPWPQTNGTLKVKGLRSKVTVLRDNFGIPNIYADNDHDLFFAQGYVTAQDRLFQMEVYRRAGNGTLSEMVGSAGIFADKFSRILGLRRIAKKSYPMLDEEVKAELQAYSEGINEFIKTHPDNLPVEYALLKIKPEPWTPLDSMSWANMMGVMKAENFSYEIFRAHITAKLGEKMTGDILPTYDPDNPVIVTRELEPFSWKKYAGKSKISSTDKKVVNENLAAGYISRLTNIEASGIIGLEKYFPGAGSIGWASGAFAISGMYTATGKPLLACDVHINLNIPNIWYEIGLHGGNYDVSGCSLPGNPYVLLGHNKKIAWGFANLNPDVEDLYLEKFDNNENPSKYLYMGKWYDIEKKQEVIKVKGSKPVVMEILFTRHGPVMNDYLRMTEQEKAELKNKGIKNRQFPLNINKWEEMNPITLRWSMDEGSLVMKSVSLLNRAGNWEEFRKAVSYWDSIGLSFIYSDDRGNIGYQAAAKIPVRNSHDLGIVPMPGWTGENDWKGFIPFDHLPFLFNPPTGFVATANTKAVTDDYPYLITYDWYHPGYRARSLEKLIADMISNKKPFTVEDMERIQSDTFSFASKQMNGYLAAVHPDNDTESKVMEYVKKWDGRFDLKSVGAAVNQVWYNYMDVNTYSDELTKNEVWGYLEPLKHYQSMVMIIKNLTNRWFDNVYTEDKTETRDDIIKASFKSTVAYLSKNFGPNPSGWTLEKLQKVNIKHQILGYVPKIGWLFNSRQTLPFAGSPTSFAMAFSGSSAPSGYNVIFAASEKHIVSFDDIDDTLSVIPTGASGHIFNPHREDQMKFWAQSGYHKMPFSKEAVIKAARDKLIIIPH